jgi:peptidoglycan/LPS O-acetylase OafA/YrhL
MNKQTSINIDFIRLSLCIVVIISHLLDLLKINNIFNNNIDLYAVWLFFVLSGYVNWQSINNNGKGFFKRRMIRLLPKYYSVLILSFLIFILTNEITNDELYKFIYSIFMIQHLNSIQAPLTNVALWSLSYEFLFYGLLSVYFLDRLVGTGLIIVALIYGLLNYYVLLLGAGFIIGIILNEYKIQFNIISLPDIKCSKWTYEIYILHYPILYLFFHTVY